MPGVDVLVTHDAPFGIFDMPLGTIGPIRLTDPDRTGGGHWGSSHQLLDAIYRIKPKVHLFGHIHEQRGHWDRRCWGRQVRASARTGGSFQGGVEYRPSPQSGQVFRPNGPPASNYPVEVGAVGEKRLWQVESNNAMANQPAVDHSWTGQWAPQHIVGRPRLIIGRREGGNGSVGIS